MLDPETAPVVRTIFDLALDGTLLREIASQLTKRGVPSPPGAVRRSPTTIREILAKHVYTGTAMEYQFRYERKLGGKYKRRPATPEE